MSTAVAEFRTDRGQRMVDYLVRYYGADRADAALYVTLTVLDGRREFAGKVLTWDGRFWEVHPR